jgi:agarase
MPLTGWLDGENYCTGEMDVTDNPPPEMIEATRELARELYRQ